MSWREALGLAVVGLRYEQSLIVIEVEGGTELLVSADWEGAQVLTNRPSAEREPRDSSHRSGTIPAQ